MVIAEINEEDGSAVAGEICGQGGEAVFFKTNVAEVQSVAAMVAETEKRYGGVHILHNNAFEELSDIEVFASFPNLERLSLRGNPVSEKVTTMQK